MFSLADIYEQQRKVPRGVFWAAFLVVIILLLFFWWLKSQQQPVYAHFVYNQNEAFTSQVVNRLIERPIDPYLEGYQFMGWYVGDELFDFQTPVHDDITLIAHWQASPKAAYDEVGLKSDEEQAIDKRENTAKQIKLAPKKQTEQTTAQSGSAASSSNNDSTTTTNSSTDNSGSSSNNTSGGGASTTTEAVPAMGQVTLLPTTATNSAVLINVTPMTGYIWEYSFDNVTYTATTAATLKVENNGVIYARRRHSGDGRTGEILPITINNIDKNVPRVTFAPDGAAAYQQSYQTQVAVTDESGIATLYYAWSQSEATAPACRHPFTAGDIITSEPSQSGIFYLWIEATDRAGNTVKERSYAFSLDNTPPDINVVDTSESSNKISISVNSDDADAGIKGFYYSKDGGLTWSGLQTAGVYIFAGLQNATDYQIQVRVEDRAGNYKDSNVVPIRTADLGAITMSVDATSWTQSKTLTVNNEQKPGEHYYYSLDGGSSWTEITAPSIQETLTANTTVLFTVTDTINEATSSFVVDHIDTFAPVVNSLEQDLSQITATTAGATVDATDSGTVDIRSGIKGYQFSLDEGVTWSALSSTPHFSFHGLTANTAYEVMVKVIDNALNEATASAEIRTANDGFVFDEASGSIRSINNFTGGPLVIPTTINDVAVKAITTSAFSGKNVTSAILPNTLETIGAYAFYRTNLVQETLIIPAGVKTIGNYAFQAPNKQIGKLIIESDSITLAQSAFNIGTIKELIIKGRATIGNSVFSSTNMEKVDLGKTVSMGTKAFYDNPIKQNVLTIPAECTTIGTSAFQSTTKEIEELKIVGTGPILLNVSAFRGGLVRHVTIEKSATIDNTVFHTTQMETMNLGNTVSINSGALAVNKLTSLIIPSSVTMMHAAALAQNNLLTTINVDQPSGALANAPWGATNAAVTWRAP